MAVVRAVESAPVRRKQPKRSRICCYSENDANVVLERLAEGQSLTELTAPGDVPGKREILAWVTENYKNFAHRYARARDTGLDVRAERLMEIARTEPDVNRAKLLCDNEKWLLSKLAPKRYGDRQQLDITVAPAEMPDEELDRELAEAAAAAGFVQALPKPEP